MITPLSEDDAHRIAEQVIDLLVENEVDNLDALALLASCISSIIDQAPAGSRRQLIDTVSSLLLSEIEQ